MKGVKCPKCGFIRVLEGNTVNRAYCKECGTIYDIKDNTINVVETRPTKRYRR
jgi:uncharacterized protein (DUF983 family)